MITQDEFVDAIVETARSHGYSIENSRHGRQIDFGYKKLHEGHLRQLYPDILTEGANIPSLIDATAPGRPCSHKPMREIVATVKTTWEVIAMLIILITTYLWEIPQ
jgi:hypothetical protein